MRVKIIKNAPRYSVNSFSIEEYIGRVYPVESENGDGTVNVDLGNAGMVTIYPEEYEVIDVAKELDDFVRKYYPYELETDDVRDFILTNRIALVKILK